MRKTSLLFILFCIGTGMKIHAQSGVQKTADKLNNGAFQAESAVNGANNTVNAVKNGAETLKSVTSIFGKGKKKKAQQDSVASSSSQDVTASSNIQVNDLAPNTNLITTIFFDKIEYLQMKQIKDSLSSHKLIADVKTNFNKEGKYFIDIQHKMDSDEILEIILAKWGEKYDVESVEAEKIVLKLK